MAYRILVSGPGPLGLCTFWDLVGVGPKGLGTGLFIMHQYVKDLTLKYFYKTNLFICTNPLQWTMHAL